ncbi:MAG: efflux RND transporter periplasmic adaptor subunit [Oscillospiraceae bacterium]
MKTDSYSETIYASGTVEEQSKEEVTSDFPLVFKKINVSAGERVHAGDVLMEVDKQATVDLLLNLASNSSDSAAASLTVTLLQMLSETSYEQIAALLPENITAPKSGVVTQLGAVKNTLILPGQQLAAISENNHMVATISVAETDIAQVALGQRVSMSGVASSDSICTGTVAAISSSARKQLSGTSLETVVDVTVDIESGAEYFKPGYTVKAEIEVEAPRQVNLLPYEAIGQDENGNEFVYVYQDGNAVRRLVESGVETSNGVEIRQGVYPSDIIIFDASTVSADGPISVQGRVS